jgi:hypothetical protein
MKTKYKILKSHYSYGGYFVQTKNGFFSFWKYEKDELGFIILFFTATEAETHIEKLFNQEKERKK